MKHPLFFCLLLLGCLISCGQGQTRKDSTCPDYLRSLYIQGCAAKDSGQAVLARDYFMKIIDAPAADTPDTAITTLKAKAYKQLGNAFIYQYMAREAAQMYSKAYALYESNNDTTGMLYCYRNLGNAFYSMNRPDSCLFYCGLAMKLVETAPSRYRYERTELNCLMLTSLVDQKKWSEAGKYHHAIAADTLNANTPAVLMTTAQYYYGIHDYRDCELTSLKILKNGNLFDRQRAARFLTNIYIRNQEIKKASRYMEAFIRFTDSVSLYRRTETLLRMDALYNYGKKEQENIKLNADAKVYRLLLVIALVSMAAVVAVFVFAMRYNRQQKALMRLKIDHYKSLRKNQKNRDADSEQRKTAMIRNSDIYKHIIRQLDTGDGLFILHNDDWRQLSLVIEQAYPDFNGHLHDICKMNNYEYRVSLLIKTGFQPSVIAGLTAHSRESVSATRRRLFEKAFNKKGTPKDWDDFILSL